MTATDPSPRARLAGLLRGTGWRRTVLLRRIAAGALAALALVLALLPRSGTAGAPVLVAAVELPAGVALRDADLAVRTWPAELVPAGALRAVDAAAGRVLIGAAHAGEPLTDLRFLDAGPAAAGGPDGAAVPIRLADAGVAALLRPGSRVDVVTVGGRAGEAAVLAADATVLAVMAEDKGTRGRLVMVGMPRALAGRVAAAALAEQVGITLRS
ncbi:SAF domain-containing protein [Pseudonocardia sp. GCM10023141]|uniref:SAF domain-containing protein n=1 Tax=Pseudonocardia sp. GCM10023141 TaxID=3252653 RepID=UPI003622DDB5